MITKASWGVLEAVDEENTDIIVEAKYPKDRGWWESKAQSLDLHTADIFFNECIVQIDRKSIAETIVKGLE